MNATFKPTVRKAQRYKVKASIMIEGLTGNGKSGLALCLGYGLVKDWNKVGAIDTENKSLDLMVGQKLSTGEVCQEFLKIDLTKQEGYSPVNYAACAEALHQNGAEVIIEDSISHSWNREDGVLDMVNQAQVRNPKLNNYTAWGAPEVVQNKNLLFELIRSADYHVITTVRVKEKFDMQNDGVTTRVVSLGEQQLQTEGLKYEPDLVLSMVEAGTPYQHPKARVIKTRYPMLVRDEVYEFTPELIEQIRLFLEEGADPNALLEQQRLEYINGIKSYCDASDTNKAIWKTIKKQYGFEKVKLDDIPLKDVKSMFVQLTSSN